MKPSASHPSSSTTLAGAFRLVRLAVLGACVLPGLAASAQPQSAQEWVASFDAHYFLSPGNGRSNLDPLFRRMQLVCEAEQGQSRVFDVTVNFKNVTQSPYVTSPQTVPQLMTCTQQGQLGWGAKLTVEAPTWLAFTIMGGGTSFKGKQRMAYLDAAQAQGELDRVQREADEAATAMRGCVARTAAAKDELLNHPAVGLEFTGGVIIDVRLPLVEVQYADHARRSNGPAREWVRADKLLPRPVC